MYFGKQGNLNIFNNKEDTTLYSTHIRKLTETPRVYMEMNSVNVKVAFCTVDFYANNAQHTTTKLGIYLV